MTAWLSPPTVQTVGDRASVSKRSELPERGEQTTKTGRSILRSIRRGRGREVAHRRRARDGDDAADSVDGIDAVVQGKLSVQRLECGVGAIEQLPVERESLALLSRSAPRSARQSRRKSASTAASALFCVPSAALSSTSAINSRCSAGAMTTGWLNVSVRPAPAHGGDRRHVLRPALRSVLCCHDVPEDRRADRVGDEMNPPRRTGLMTLCRRQVSKIQALTRLPYARRRRRRRMHIAGRDDRHVHARMLRPVVVRVAMCRRPRHCHRGASGAYVPRPRETQPAPGADTDCAGGAASAASPLSPRRWRGLRLPRSVAARCFRRTPADADASRSR